MASFRGNFERSLDQKGRVALPPAWRSKLGVEAVVTVGADGCLTVSGAEDFRLEEDRRKAMVERREMHSNELRVWSGNAFNVELDGQGRIAISARNLSLVGLGPGESVVLVGVLDRIEIWAPARWAEIEADGRARSLSPEVV
jgi:MraZ protein